MTETANHIFLCWICLGMAITAYAGKIPEDSFTGRKLLNSTAPEPDKSIWQEIEEFYEDKNNFAMYLVLPLLVFVYGGCSLIYCIAKCRRHLKKKKHKQSKFDRQDIDDDEGPLTDRNDTEEPRQERRGAKQTSASDVRVAVDRENTSTPLPWQVPDDKESLYPHKNPPPRKPEQRNAMNNHPNNHSSPPPPYDDFGGKPVMNRPMVNTVSNPGNDHRNRNAMESYAMAKQAAELLRQEDHYRQGGGGYKKAKRLVFVAD
ncbi:uncharacterized protein LOC117342089 [Pecten maximus]|uniref:uncharacterized protein LOC117342089 n=1 Tax=Pecten maximus TaxID=6579 RepID=UPI001458A223|nr:uncharacterized protein LOC117342089 [Pecten maximus]XP_033759968.1 uncharacterized protein LOC117342089 [Pecten maximus]